jgi:hypothetical protein
MNRPPLPRHWSPEQALAVFEYVQLLSEQIWSYYYADIVSLLGEDFADDLRHPPLHWTLPDLFDDNLDDSDLPF